MSEFNVPLTDADLDRLAATKIMGWKWSESLFIWLNLDGTYVIAPKTNKGPWQPTRNIAQAWELLEKFPHFDIEKETQKDGVVYYAASVSYPCRCNELHHDGHYVDLDMQEAEAPTAAEAIVRACLKAKGAEV